MRFLKGMALLCVSLTLAACGGGKDSTSTSTGPTAADLALVLSKTSVTNSGSDTVTATVTAVDASRNALSGIPVSISVDNGAVAVVGGSATDSSGQVASTVQIGNDKSNRIVTITATSGSLVRTASFSVTGTKLQATVLQAVIAPGASGEIQYRLTDVNDNAIANAAISVSGPGISAVSGTTDSVGAFDFSYTAPQVSGNLVITASAGGVTNTQTVFVQSGSGAIPAVSGGIATVLSGSASVSANPSVVPVNTDVSTNRSEIRALFVGASNAPIPNVRVLFDLAGDANSIGGTLSSGGNIVYSDSNGLATTAYIPGTRSSPTNGVTVRACYYADDASSAAGGCPNFVTTTLTVISEPLAVTIGTDNKISEGAGGLTYIKKFVVLVVDASGQAKADVQITPSVDLISYIKGWYDGPGGWNRDAPLKGAPILGVRGYTGPTCWNEDVNRNGVLEANEDDGQYHSYVIDGAQVQVGNNANGKLDPRKSDVAISMVGSSKTDSSGIAVLQIEYPKNVATWINFKILVSASGVSGTEGRATWVGTLPAADGDFKATAPPAFVDSPYGFGVSDTNGDGVVDCLDQD